MFNYLSDSLVPMVIEQTGRGERSFDIFSRLLSDRIIILSEEINDTTASLVVAQMLFLEAQDPDKDISLYINSPGGSVTAGMAIYCTSTYRVLLSSLAELVLYIFSGASNPNTSIQVSKMFLQSTKSAMYPAFLVSSSSARILVS